MIATNGWQWILVQRKLGRDGCYFYYHLPAISFGELSVVEKSPVDQDGDEEFDNDDEETESQQGMARTKRIVIKKSDSNHCYDQICHLLAIMFDNMEFLWNQLEDKGILNKSKPESKPRSSKELTMKNLALFNLGL
mmetsp:Transcript_8281/g.12349  ORF Transcript_8281/g.12349 Transcript_8281/m.12349 type:complete len:136 (+) Transcript_8281:742-1149(+)